MSKIASETRSARAAQILSMTPERRMLLALELGDDDATIYSAAHGLAETEARRILQTGRQRGRLSRCARND